MYNGTVKDYGSHHFLVESQSDINNTSEIFSYSITNNLKNDISEFGNKDEYNVILDINGYKHETTLYIDNGKKKESTF